MPSINRPTWRGVSTSSEQSTLHFITESVRSLERSTTLMRQNLPNLIDHDNEENVHIEIDIRDIRSSNQSQSPVSPVLGNASDLPDADKVTQEVQQVLDRNKELKIKVQEVIESNATFKEEIKNCLKESSDWRHEFAQESKRLEMEMEAVIVHDNPVGILDGSDDPTCGLGEKVKSWWNVAVTGIVTRTSVLSSLREKWASFRFTDVLPDMMEFSLSHVPYDYILMQY